MRLPRAHPILSGSRRRSLFAPFAVVLALLMAISNAGVVLAWSNLTFSSTEASLMIQLTNQARASSGLKALLPDSTLTSIARTRAKYIYDHTWGYHCSYPNKTCATRMFATLLYSSGYCFKVAGENLGYNNYPDDQTTQWQFNWFMGSPGHKANILGTTYDHIGVGAYKGTKLELDLLPRLRDDLRPELQLVADPNAEADAKTNPASHAATNASSDCDSTTDADPEVDPDARLAFDADARDHAAPNAGQRPVQRRPDSRPSVRRRRQPTRRARTDRLDWRQPRAPGARSRPRRQPARRDRRRGRLLLPG